MVFSYFAIPPELQIRVLLHGVMGALLMRTVLRYLGALMIQQFDWIFYVFGAFLFFTGIKMLLFTGTTTFWRTTPCPSGCDVIGASRQHSKVHDFASS